MIHSASIVWPTRQPVGQQTFSKTNVSPREEKGISNNVNNWPLDFHFEKIYFWRRVHDHYLFLSSKSGGKLLTFY